MCPNCTVTLTVHRRWRALRCHYCDHTIAPPPRCGSCGEPALESWGVGTEQLEGLLRARFPGARIARMDRDSTRRKGSQQTLLRSWNEAVRHPDRHADDTPRATDVPASPVCRTSCTPTPGQLPDFRAAERTFQSLAQSPAAPAPATRPAASSCRP